MSWKAVEMQVALPRTLDAGRMKAEQQKQGEHLQGALTQARQQQDEIKRTQVNTSEETAKIKENKEDREKGQANDDERKSMEKQDSSIEHPYLGTKIDLNL